MNQSHGLINDLTLKCRSGAELHVASSKLLEGSHSHIFREIIEKAVTERNPLQGRTVLNVPDDDPDAWRVCWALMNDAANLPALDKENFTAALRLASKHQMCGVLRECEYRMISGMLSGALWNARVMMTSFCQKSCSGLLRSILVNTNGKQGFDDCFQFLGLLWDVGLKSMYTMAISFVLQHHGKELPPYLRQRLGSTSNLADCLEVSKDVATWFASIAEIQKGFDLP